MSSLIGKADYGGGVEGRLKAETIAWIMCKPRALGEEHGVACSSER